MELKEQQNGLDRGRIWGTFIEHLVSLQLTHTFLIYVLFPDSRTTVRGSRLMVKSLAPTVLSEFGASSHIPMSTRYHVMCVLEQAALGSQSLRTATLSFPRSIGCIVVSHLWKAVQRGGHFLPSSTTLQGQLNIQLCDMLITERNQELEELVVLIYLHTEEALSQCHQASF